MIEWIEVTDSTRVTAVAYDADQERILVRFPDGKEHEYLNCPAMVWDEFIDPSTSKGRFIFDQLNQHPHGPHLA